MSPRPGDHPGPPRPPWTTKTAIARQIYSARSSRLLHLNPSVATHHPKESPGLLCGGYIRKGALFGRPQGQPGGKPRLLEGADAPWGKEFTDSAPGPATTLYIIYMHISEFACVVDGKSDSVRLQCDAMRCDCDAMGCEAVCACEEERL